MKINLISDTVTKPSPDMLAFMMSAEVGDDVFREDPTVNALEEKVARLLGKESALFCPSGTMTNQIAIKGHTEPLDEVICDVTSHIYQYETAGYAFHSGVGLNTLSGEYGKITALQIAGAIKPQYDWLPRTRLVVLENTCNKGGGSYYTLEEIRPISALCREKGLALHLDGARLFNALVETGDSAREMGSYFDSVSLCLSKGLGAPVGSVLAGEEKFIRKARRIRKVMGGGMRQAGYLAAAGIYALDHNIARLKTDNDNARRLGTSLESLPYVHHVRPVKSNIVIFDVKQPYTAASFLEAIAGRHIAAAAFGAQTVRFVTHLDFVEEMVPQVEATLEELALDFTEKI